MARPPFPVDTSKRSTPYTGTTGNVGKSIGVARPLPPLPIPKPKA